MLEISSISHTVAGRTIIEDLSVQVADGTSLAIVGASGTGKTTLLNIMSLLVRPTRGALAIDGEDLQSPSERRRKRFWRDNAAFILQDYGLISDETAAYNVMLSTPPLRKSKAQTNPRVLEALDAVGLKDRAGSRVAQLSGGEKQRVGIARALFKDAQYVFADEPTASLDRGNSDRVTELLLHHGNPKRTTIIATHDLTLAAKCDAQLELMPARTLGMS